jgi:hypothetical protein
MRPQDIPPRIARLNQLANGLQKVQADLIRDGRPFARQELEAYLDGAGVLAEALEACGCDPARDACRLG